jgi:hypothetical protein
LQIEKLALYLMLDLERAFPKRKALNSETHKYLVPLRPRVCLYFDTRIHAYWVDVSLQRYVKSRHSEDTLSMDRSQSRKVCSRRRGGAIVANLVHNKSIEFAKGAWVAC